MKLEHERIEMKTLDLWATAWAQAPGRSVLPRWAVRAIERLLAEAKAVLWSWE